MVTRYGQADVPREVSGRGGPAVRPAAADFPRDVCLTVSRNHAVFLLYPQGQYACFSPDNYVSSRKLFSRTLASLFIACACSIPREIFTRFYDTPDSKIHGANMGTIWGRQDPIT